MLFIPLVYWTVRRQFMDAWRSEFRPGIAATRCKASRMQDTAEGFGQPIRRIFSPFFKRTREHPSPFDTHPRYHWHCPEDPIWAYWLYLPITRLVERGTRLVAFLQQGRIAIYLLYSFATLLTLLVP